MAVNLAVLVLIMECWRSASETFTDPRQGFAPEAVTSASRYIGGFSQLMFFSGRFLLFAVFVSYLLFYVNASLRVGRYICSYTRWSYEPVFDLVVLGVPDFILFVTYWIIIAVKDRPEGSLGNTFELIFSGADALSMAAAVLVIMYPVFLIAKTPFTEYAQKKDREHDERGEAYLRCKDIVGALVELAPGKTAMWMRNRFHSQAWIYGYKKSAKKCKNKSRLLIGSAIAFAIVLSLTCLLNLEAPRDLLCARLEGFVTPR